MSQRVNAAPTPADAATALASTQAIHPELTNRKDIPLTAFDFLDGAYGATKRARAIGIGILGTALLLLSWTAFSGWQASSAVGEVRAQVEELRNSRGSLVGEFGGTVEGIPTEDLLDHERRLAAGFASVTKRQGDFLSLFEELRGLSSPEAQVSSVTYGAAAGAAKPSSSGDAQAAPAMVSVRILVTGSSLSATVALADRITQVAGLQNVDVDLGGTGASVVGQISLERPPQPLITRLESLGVRSDADKRAREDQATAETPEDGEAAS